MKNKIIKKIKAQNKTLKTHIQQVRMKIIIPVILKQLILNQKNKDRKINN